MKTNKLTLMHFMCFCFGLFSISLMSQVGINTTTPHASSVLDMVSTEKGFLIPRVDLDDTSTAAPVTSPAVGLLVYNDGGDATDGYYYWDGSNWILTGASGAVSDNLGNHTATQNINLNGNSITNNGTTAGITLNNTGKVTIGNELKVNSIPSGNTTSDQVLTVDATGNVRKVLASSVGGGGGSLTFNTVHITGSATLSNDVTHATFNSGATVTLPNPADNSGEVIVLVCRTALPFAPTPSITFAGTSPLIPIRAGIPTSGTTTQLVMVISNGTNWIMQEI